MAGERGDTGAYERTEQKPTSSGSGGTSGRFPWARILLVFAQVLGLLGFLSFLGGFVFRLALMVTSLHSVTKYGPWACVALSAGAASLGGLALARIRKHGGSNSCGKAILVFAFSLLLLGSSSVLICSYELRQSLASLLCDCTFTSTFRAHRAAGGPEVTPRVMRQTRSVLLRRLDREAYGLVRIEIVDVNCVRIDQNLHGAVPPSALLDVVTARGILEFRILPLLSDESPAQQDILGYREQLERLGPTKDNDREYLWKKIKSPQDFHVAEAITAEFDHDMYVLTSNRRDQTMLYSYDKDVWGIRRAYSTLDQMGNGAVGFTFDAAGASRFYALTQKSLDRPLSILMDDEVVTTPRIESAISSSGQITGRFTLAEVDYLVSLLNFAPLPVDLEVVYADDPPADAGAD